MVAGIGAIDTPPCVGWAGHQVPYLILAAMTAAGLIVKSADGYCLAD
jgi:hypothetical protein